MNNNLYNMLKTSAEADVAKAKLTLDLLSDHAVGIGDHSTEDFYKNAEEALSLLADANDRLENLKKYKNEADYPHPNI
jgi:hypothetical protein|tara:strand:- start:765 stop:998 length:234 start_codon:yes stop_codon:yes gene_type:complete